MTVADGEGATGARAGPSAGTRAPRRGCVLAARLAGSRLRGRPHTLSHLVTTRCNGRCRTCLWRDGTPGELDAATVAWLYEQAGRAGMAQLVVWGGEPLLRQDLPELLLAAHRAGLLTTLITNGWLLADRWPELRGHVDALILSLDDVGRAHDELRGLPGLYERLEAFVPALRADPLRPTLLVNTVLSGLNRGALRRVAAVARRWQAGLYFCPMETGELSAGEAGDRLAGLALLARRAAGGGPRWRWSSRPQATRSSTSRPYLRMLADDPSLSAYTCRAPRARLTVGADGSVRDCMHVGDRPLGNVASLRTAGSSAGLAVPHRLSGPLRMERRGGVLHQVQQPGRRRTLLAVGPAPRDAQQGPGAGKPLRRRGGARTRSRGAAPDPIAGGGARPIAGAPPAPARRPARPPAVRRHAARWAACRPSGAGIVVQGRRTLQRALQRTRDMIRSVAA